jgi:hypothetical protein
MEHDFPPTMRQRRRRQPILEGEILTPQSEPQPRIRVEVRHTYSQRQREQIQIPPWLIVLLIVAGLLWISPIGVIVAIAIVTVLVIQHLAVVITSAIIIAVLVFNSIRRRRVGC